MAPDFWIGQLTGVSSSVTYQGRKYKTSSWFGEEDDFGVKSLEPEVSLRHASGDAN